MNTRRYIFCGLICFAALNVGTSVWNLYGNMTVRDTAEQVSNRPLIAVESAQRLSKLFSRMREIVAQSVSYTTIISMNQGRDDYETLYEEYEREVGYLKTLMSPRVQSELNGALAAGAEWKKAAIMLISDDGSVRIPTQSHLARLEETIHAHLDRAIQFTGADAADLQRQISEKAQAAIAWNLISLVASVLLGSLILVITWIKSSRSIGQMEQAARWDSAVLSTLMDAWPDLVFVKDLGSRFVLANRRVASVIGVDTPAELIGKSDFDLFPEDVASQFREKEVRVLQSGEFIIGEEEFTESNMGQGAWLSNTKLPIVIDGKIVGLVGVNRDITSMKKAEFTLKQHHVELERLVEEKTCELKGKADELEVALEKEREIAVLQRQFVSMVSHEFRTPLTIIDATAQRLLRKCRHELEVDKVEQGLGRVRDAVKRLIGLIESTLDATRIELGKITFSPSEIDVTAVVDEAVQMQTEISPGRLIELDVPERPILMQGDAALLNQVLTNLLSNALKYSDAPAMVRASCSRLNGDVVIAVSDNGVGIPQDELEKLFIRFFRASTSQGKPGTGIGLYLVKHLVELHQGDIGVTSQEGVGTTFRVVLPMVQQTDANDISHAQVKHAIGARK